MNHTCEHCGAIYPKRQQRLDCSCAGRQRYLTECVEHRAEVAESDEKFAREQADAPWIAAKDAVAQGRSAFFTADQENALFDMLDAIREAVEAR